MSTQEQFLSKRQRYQPIAFPQHFSEEEMARDWTLSDSDRAEIRKRRTSFRLFVAIQLCAVRLYGRFFTLVQHFAVTIGQPTEKKAANGSAHVACTPFGIDLQGLDGLGCQF